MKKRMIPALPSGPYGWRLLIQWAFLLWTVYAGVLFGLFVRHYTGGGGMAVARPPSVDGFLPVGALISLRHWLESGVFPRVHPAALVLLLTFVGMSALAKRSFCSFVCPLGTLSEALWKLGSRLPWGNLRMWRPLDLVLRAGKYALLLFFLRLVAGMPSPALPGFLSSPYWAVADVKMLYFFAHLSLATLLVLLALVLLSLPFRNFWCRYLCPYGALVGLFSFLSPWKVRRDRERCVDCGACTRACPSRLPVERLSTVRSPECTGCLSCVRACPSPRTLEMALPLRRRLPAWVYPACVLLLFALGVGTGMVTGNWHGVLTEADYRQLVPLAGRLGF